MYKLRKAELKTSNLHFPLHLILKQSWKNCNSFYSTLEQQLKKKTSQP